MNAAVGSEAVDGEAEDQPQRKVDAVDEELGAKKVYGDYEVIRPIGKGKFAVVYRAQRISDGVVVALKRISVDQIDQKARDKCLKEVRLLQSLDHPNIIRYLDSFINEDDLVIVVEWAAAGDLKRQLRKAQEKGTPFEERIIWKYFSQIADAIRHMHDRRIMHRDLKPANIFLTLDGTIKVGDLGLSRELSEDTFQAQSKVGTPLYMSPEVLRGDKYDFKTDVWSLGCLLYELAVLKSPFKAEGLNIYSLFQKISEGQYQPIPSDYSEDLRNLAYSMLSTKSEDRPELSYVCDVARRLRAQLQEKHVQSRKLASSSSKSKLPSPSSDNNPNTSSPNESKISSDVDTHRQNQVDAARSKSKASRSTKTQDSDRMPVMSLNTEWENGKETADATNEGTYTKNAAPPSELASGVAAYDGWGFDNASQESRAGAGIKSDPPVHEQQSGAEVYRRPKSTQSIRAVPTGGTKSNSSKGAGPNTGKPPLPGGSSAKEASARLMETNAVGLGDDNAPYSGGLSRPASQGQLVLDANLSESGQAFVSMSSLYDKLTLLGYQFGQVSSSELAKMRPCVPILPCQFAVDVSKIGAGARKDKHIFLSSTAFSTFVAVASWLFGKIDESSSIPGYKAPEFDFDDVPHILAKRILLETQNIGVSSNEISEINTTSLLPGFGLRVCQLLNVIADKALVACRHSWKPFKYEKVGSADLNAAADDSGAEPFDEVGDEAVREELSRDVREESVEFGKSTGGDSLHRSMILPAPEISPVEWALETERVAIKLSAKTNAVQAGYAANMANIERHSRFLRNGHAAEPDISADALQKSLVFLGSGTADSIAALKRAEDLMNNRWASLRAEMERVLKAKNECEASLKVVSERVGPLSSELSELSEKLDEVNEALESKSQGGLSSEDGGNASIIALKQALRTLRDETKAMALSIGLISAQLLSEQQRGASRKVRRRRRSDKTSQFDSDTEL